MAQGMMDEEILVAELELLGIGYLSRQSGYRAAQTRPPAQLLADLVRQPSARVRQAVISVLLAHPEYASAVPEALRMVSAKDGLTLRLLYTAAVLLQEKYADELRGATAQEQMPLPDLFSEEFGLSVKAPVAYRMATLGQSHQQATGIKANWAGTYDNVARKLLRRWEMERRWSQHPLPQK